eukprot:16448514-Heterocapsa_arctica.AAC.1
MGATCAGEETRQKLEEFAEEYAAKAKCPPKENGARRVTAVSARIVREVPEGGKGKHTPTHTHTPRPTHTHSHAAGSGRENKPPTHD